MTNSIGSTERRRLVAAAATSLACLALGALVLWSYSFRPTPATMFLMLGGFAMVACGYFLVRAVSSFDPDREEISLGDETGDRETNELEQEKRFLLKAIKEVEFDQAMGKLDDTEAAATISRYRIRALDILKQLDQRMPVDYRAKVQAELAQRLGSAAPDSAPSGAEAVAAAAAVVATTEATELPAGQCACGTANDVDAVFCKKCGARMVAAEAQA